MVSLLVEVWAVEWTFWDGRRFLDLFDVEEEALRRYAQILLKTQAVTMWKL